MELWDVYSWKEGGTVLPLRKVRKTMELIRKIQKKEVFKIFIHYENKHMWWKLKQSEINNKK